MIRFAIVAALALGGCSGFDKLANNPNCTTKINGKIAFGAAWPTGDTTFSTLCRPGGPASPDPGLVPTPKPQ